MVSCVFLHYVMVGLLLFPRVFSWSQGSLLGMPRAIIASPHVMRYRGHLRSTMMDSVPEIEYGAPSSSKVKASARLSAFNLAKCVGGVGVFALPAGVALFSDSKKAVIPAAALCIALGLVSAYTFSLYGRACAHYKTTTLKETWSKAVGEDTAWIVSFASTLKTLFACLTFSIVIGDSFTSLAKSMGAPALLHVRTNMILLMSFLVVLPLCLLQSLAALAPFSAMGMAGTIYTKIFMMIRLVDGSYRPGGKFFNDVVPALQPVFGARPLPVNPLTMVLVSMLSTAYIAHYNAPTFYSELRDNTMPRFNAVSLAGFGIAIFMTLWVTLTGFLTFGGNASGYILNNYSGMDKLASIARCSVGITILTSYPFTFTALRTGCLDMLGVPVDKRPELNTPTTLMILGAITSAAMVITNVGFAVSFAGALFGNALMYCAPAIIEIARTRDTGTISFWNLLVNRLILGGGAVLGILGAAICVLKEIGKI